MARRLTLPATLFSILLLAPASAAFAWWGVGFSGTWGWYGPPYPPPPYDYGWAVPESWAAAEMHVHPRKATVLVDGHPAGRARDFNSAYSPLWLKAGEHLLELRYPDYMVLRIRVRARSRAYYDLHYRLEEGSGIDPRSARFAPAGKSAPGRHP